VVEGMEKETSKTVVVCALTGARFHGKEACAAAVFERPGTWVTELPKHIGNSLRVDAVSRGV
jgi:hypothetical protein